MRNSRTLAREAATDDLRRAFEDSQKAAQKRGQDIPQFQSFEDAAAFGDCSNQQINVLIGARGYLTKKMAKQYGEGFRILTRVHSRANFRLYLAGYDNDPRGPIAHAEACKYLKWFCHYSGLDDPVVAHRWLGEVGLPELRDLALAGVFKEAVDEGGSVYVPSLDARFHKPATVLMN